MTKVKCKKCNKDHDYQGDNTVSWTCPDCRTLNKLPAIALAVIFSLAILTVGPVFAETITFQYETENLNKTNTWNVTQTLENGWIEQSIFAEWIYLYPNGTEVKPKPVIADPVGKFFELLITDSAKIFKPIVEPVGEFFEALEEAIANVTESEPEPKYTHEEQVLIDDVYLHCEKLNERLTAIGLAFDFDYETDEFYVNHPTVAIKHKEDCRARVHLGNNVLGSMYDALKEEAKIDAENFGKIISTKGPTHSAKINITKIKESEANRAEDDRDSNVWTKNVYNMTKIPDPVVPTNQTKEVMTATELHQYEEQERIKNRTILCSELLWPETGNGTVSLRNFPTKLLDGFCNDFVFITQWEYDEDMNTGEKITKQVDLQELIKQKIAAGDKPPKLQKD